MTMSGRLRVGGLIVLGTLAALSCPPLRAATFPLGDVAEVAVGRAHSCALDRAGAVSCWGSNGVGQLGSGDPSTVSHRTTPVPVSGAGAGNLAIAAGDAHTCVITAERGVRCWGLGLGTGSGDENFIVAEPAAVNGLPSAVTAISAGAEHSCALLDDGRIACWGGNARGQLGDGSRDDRLAAVLVAGLGGRVRLIEAGGAHTCAVLEDGQTRCWGFNESGQLGDGSRSDRALPTPVQGLPDAPRSLAAGSGSTCAVSAGGALYCWGAQYPLGAFDGGSAVARAYPGFASGYVQVDGGSFHYCARREDGRVKCLGDNVDGQLGTGPVDDSSGAEFVLDLDPDIVQIASGGWHSCARSGGGGMQCWGRNAEGQLGIDTLNRRLVPTAVAGLDSGQAQVAAGGFHSCGLGAEGAVNCWGFNGAGQLGDGSTRFRSRPVAVSGLDAGTRALESGDSSSCAINAAGRVQCWGANFDGRLGNGQTLDSSVPVDVVGLDGEVSAIAVGREHGCALLASGAVRCWGSNAFGQLGSGDGLDRLSAVPVSGLDSGVSAIAAGYYHSCALHRDGPRCWGNNQYGQLGDGSRENRPTPVAVADAGGAVIAIEAGIVHTCALLQGGAVSCWGYADFGSLLGDGSTEDRLRPAPVPALSEGVVQIALGGFHSCARTAAGALLCWGQGGSIGDNSLVHRPSPTTVAGLDRGVQHVSAGFGGQTCAVVAGGSRCWGENSFAQVGDGSTHGEPQARRVLGNELLRRVGPVLAQANGASDTPQLSANGRYLVFVSESDNLVDGDSNGVADVFVLDREHGTLRRASLDSAGAQLAAAASAPTVSADGALVAFLAPASAATTLLGESAKARAQRRKQEGLALYLRNMLTGSTRQIAPASASAPPRLAAQGGSLVFTALPTTPDQGDPTQTNVFLVTLPRDGDEVQPGPISCLSCKRQTADGSAGSDNADGASEGAVISADGQWVAYTTQASNSLAASPSPCPTGSRQVLLRNMLTGTTQRISPPPGLPAGGCGVLGSGKPSIDLGGQVIAFESDQALTGDRPPSHANVYAWRAGETSLQRLSVAADGTEPAAPAAAPQVSGDGRQVVFTSAAPNLDLSFADNNDHADLHSVELQGEPTPRRLSRTASGAEADGDAGPASLGFDGSELVFASAANNLTGSRDRGTGSAFARLFSRANPAAPPRRSATWWIPAESGWGLTIFDQGDLLAPTWFTYDADGEPTWFIVGGAFPQQDGSFRGELLRLTGTPFDQIDGPAARSVASVGEIALSYSGSDTLRFDYRVDAVQQSKTLRRFGFGSRDFSCAASVTPSRREAANYTDLWTGAGPDAGWGLTLFHVDDMLVAVWYTYDSDGEAVFFLLTTTRQPDGRFTGEVFRQRDGTPFSAIDGSQPSPGEDTIGSAAFRFLDGEQAEFSYRIGAIEQTQRIERLLVGSQASVCRSEDAAR